MKISDKEIIDAFNDLKINNHPDPLGFIARAQVLTGLNDSRTSDGFKGPFAVNISKAKSLGYLSSEINDKDRSVEIQSLVDLDSYNQAGQKLEGMYRLSLARGKNKFKTFMTRLDRKRKELEDKFNLDADGFLSSIGSNTEAKRNDDVIVTTEDRREAIDGTDVVSTDEFNAKPKRPTNDIDMIEKNLRVLIRILMREVQI